MRRTVLGNTAIDHFDAIVIGSGAGGGPVAHVLTEQGLTVLVIEAGPNHFDFLDDGTKAPVPRFSNDELKIEARSFIMPDDRLDPRSFRKNEAAGVRTFVGNVQALPKTVGGGSVHADLKMPRFAPFDFQLGTLLKDVPNASFADWPVQYDALEPFYAWGERLLGVYGVRGSNPFEGPMKDDYPLAPGPVPYFDQVMGKGIAALGYTMHPYPGAINSRPYDGRPACIDCGYCSSYGCPINAKGSTAVTVLRKALLTGKCQLRAETRAVRLLANATKTEITGVECIGPTGERVTFVADRYVLAASPIEDARLLLMSDNLGNSSELVGRNLTFHHQTIAIGIFDERLHSHHGHTVSSGFSDFRGKPNDPAHPLGGIVEISSSGHPIGEAKFYTQILTALGFGRFDGKAFRRLLRESPGRERVLELVMQAEDAPQVKNRIDLDPELRDVDGLPVARITYENHPFETSASEFYLPKLLEVFEKAGARYALPAPTEDFGSSQHIMGTLRFGADPKTSVCDPSGRFHDIGNLYASDGALFPTSSGWNPTMTIFALALRVAAEMVHPGSPERAIK